MCMWHVIDLCDHQGKCSRIYTYLASFLTTSCRLVPPKTNLLPLKYFTTTFNPKIASEIFISSYITPLPILYQLPRIQIVINVI